MAESERAAIAHLFRRAGFGARRADLRYYERHGYARAVDDLVSARPLAGALPAPSTGSVNALTKQCGGRLTAEGLAGAQKDLVQSFVTSDTPLVERMVLLLLDHFATPFSGMVRLPEVYAQTALLRAHALGNWAELLHRMIEDVALACSLDAQLNRRGRPNENLAREFLELFALGRGYTEWDVREGARALTGYRVTSQRGPFGEQRKLEFDQSAHDSGEKTIFGRRGAFGPHDFVNLVLQQPAARSFIAERLVTTFGTPNPPASIVQRVANAIYSSNWSLAAGLQELFRSSEFIGNFRNTLVKSPAELVVGAMRALNATNFKQGASWAAAAGQSLYQPPNVGGWPGGNAWLSAGGLLARYNGGLDLANATVKSKTGTYVRADSVDQWALIFGMTDLMPTTRAALSRHMNDTRSAPRQERDRDAISLMIATPEFSVA